MFWGGMDLAFLVIYAVVTSTQRHIPFYNELVVARSTEPTYGGSLPSFIAWAGLALYLSLFVSGGLLVYENRIGRYLAYCQTPFRLALIVPSFFPVAYLLGGHLGVYGGVALIVATEAWKIATLANEARMDTNTLSQPNP